MHKRPCPKFGDARVKAWDLNTLSLSAGLAIQGNRLTTSVAPLNSVWFTAATTSMVNDHGILGNLDPEDNIIRTWDVDTRLGFATGIGANYLDQDDGAVWVSSALPVVHRVDPVARGQWTWTLPVNPTTSTLRGIRVAPDNAVFISMESGTGPGSILRLDPTTDTLTRYTLPTESAPFDGRFGPDGEFFFCEFSTNRIARLNPNTGDLVEYPLPDGGNPLRLFVVADGAVWFVDQKQVGRLDPATGALVTYAKAGVVPQALTPVSCGRFPPLWGLADGEPFVDVLCGPPERPVFTSEAARSQVQRTSISITPAPSRPNLAQAEVIPGCTEVEPVDPPEFVRYGTETPTFAVTEYERSLYATGADFLRSIFRLYQIQFCVLRP